MDKRSIDCSLQWESNVTAFSVISGSSFMYVGDEYGFMSVLKYDPEHSELLQTQYQLSAESLAEATGLSIPSRKPIVGILPQPCSSWNRILITYGYGLIVLWDVVEAKVIFLRSNKLLPLKKEISPPNESSTNIIHEEPSHDLEKEISALCWASTDGSVLAVGYVDGDILFLNTSQNSCINGQENGLSKNVVKLQLSSVEKRLPVIVLHWLEDNSKSRNQRQGQLIVYGGDDIGCDEVVTVLSLEWSTGMEAVRCMRCVDLTLTGSFADMILIPPAGTTRSDTNASLFVLSKSKSNSGQIHIYDIDDFSSSGLASGKELQVSAIDFPASIPTLNPVMTVSQLFCVYGSIEAVESKIAAVNTAQTLPGNRKWPVTGGISNHATSGKDNNVCRLFVAGYQDGSVRIWDATNPVFRLLCVLTTEVKGGSLVDSGAPLTKIDLCSSTSKLAVGCESGLVLLYNLHSSGDTGVHFVTETTSEVHKSAQVRGPRCEAVFKLQKSGVRALKFVNNGSKLIVGYECSRIAVLDLCSPSTLFTTDFTPSSSVVSVIWKELVSGMTKNTDESSSKTPAGGTEELIFVLNKDASIYAVDGKSGSLVNSKPMRLKKKSIPLSFYVIESHETVHRCVEEPHPLTEVTLRNELSQKGAQGSDKHKTQDHSLGSKSPALSLKELFILLCSNDALRVYSAKSIVQGESKSISKVELSKPCSWTTVLKKDTQICGVVVFYETGEIEIRSLPDLELVKNFSLISDLRWNFKVNMDKMISSTENGQIVLVNGCEVAFMSLLEGENDFRIPESLPNLHDELLSDTANAAIGVSADSERKEGINICGILGDILKGFMGWKSDDDSPSKYNINNLEDIFKNPISVPLTAPHEEEYVKLSIDGKSKRKKLFDDDDDFKPQFRTYEEIIAKYRGAEYGSSADGKLLERQKRLERISRRTKELRAGAEEFASSANELVEAMEKRKWYQ